LSPRWQSRMARSLLATAWLKLHKITEPMSAIDDAIDKLVADKNDAIAKMEWWRKEAERWRAQAIDLDAQVESAIASMTTRMDRIERQLKQFTDIDL
jgi:septation ring formation regulator EzrA